MENRPSPASPASRLADLHRQGFVSSKRTKRTKKSEAPIVACDLCLDWHREGKHSAPLALRRERVKEKKAKAKTEGRVGYALGRFGGQTAIKVRILGRNVDLIEGHGSIDVSSNGLWIATLGPGNRVRVNAERNGAAIVAALVRKGIVVST